MAKKRKVKADRVLIVLLAIILIILLVILGVKYLFSNLGTKKNNEDTVVNVDENIKVSLANYDVYELNNDLGFGFVVADINFESNLNNIEYDLGNLVTDEGVKLSDTFSYENKLRTSNYDFNALGTTNIVSSSSNKATCKLFIPYILANKSVVVTDMKYDNSFVIDISGNKKNVSEILNKSTEEQIISVDYDFTCSKPYIEDMMKHNGEPYDSSMLSVYVFKLKCNSIKDGVKVVNAIFVDSSGNGFDAYDESYSSSKVDNIIGKTIKEGDAYGLFFELYSNEEDKIEYEGTIKLTFSDKSTVEINTVLN